MLSSISPAHEETIDELLLSHGADTVSTANCWFVYTTKDAEFYPDWSDFYSRYLSKHKLQIKCVFKSAGSGSVPWISVRVIEGN